MITEIETYLNSLQNGGFSTHTLRGYRKDLQKLVDYFKITEISNLEALTVSDFISFYNSLPLKASSKNGLIRNLSAFFSWSNKNGILKSETFSKVTFGSKNHYMKEEEQTKVILSQEETESLIKSGKNTQERFMLALMLFTGIRRGEVVKIMLSDVHDTEIVIHGKGGHIRSVFMDEVVHTMYNVYMAERDSNSPYLFFGEHANENSMEAMSTQSVYNRVKAAGERAGIAPEKLEKLTPHRLRGTAVTRLIILFGLDVAQRVAGHSSPETTKIYDESGSALVKSALLGQRKAMEDKLNGGK